MEHLDSLSEDEKEAFWNVIADLPDSIYSESGPGASKEEVGAETCDDALSAELLALTENHNVFLRIYKEVGGCDNLQECVKALKDFYNNPANENVWKRKS